MRLKRLILGLCIIIVTFMLLSFFESSYGTLAGAQDKTVDYEKTIQDCQKSPKVYTLKAILPFLTWNKTFGGSAVDRAYSLIQTTDGGYAVAGVTDYYYAVVEVTDVAGNGSYGNFWVIKLDSRGNKLWDKTFGGSKFDKAYSLIQTNDG
jgi:hypothetical protein